MFVYVTHASGPQGDDALERLRTFTYAQADTCKKWQSIEAAWLHLLTLRPKRLPGVPASDDAGAGRRPRGLEKPFRVNLHADSFAAGAEEHERR